MSISVCIYFIIGNTISKITTNISQRGTIRGWLDRGAASYPDKVFLESVDQKTSATYAEVTQFCRRLSRKLKKIGFGPNDRVALLSNNALEHLLIYFGVMYYGATICTIHVEMNAVIIKEILKSLDPKLVLF